MHIFGLIMFAGIASSSPIGQILVTQKTVVSNLYTEQFERYKTKLPTILENSTLTDENNYQDCICTPFHKCKTYKIAPDGNEIIDIKINAAPCQSYFDICCNNTKITSTENYNPSKPDSIDSDGGFNGPEDYNKELNINHKDITKKPSDGHEGDHTKEHRKCGVWNKYGVGFRIKNAMNSESQFGEFPSTVVLFEEKFSKNGEIELMYVCVGSLIKTDVILSSSWFTRKDISTLVVRAGEWDIKTEKEILNHQDRRIKNVVTRSYSNSLGIKHDGVTLIFTEHSFSLQDNIQLICLPSKDDIIIKDSCYSSDWYKTVSYNNYTIVKKTESGKTLVETGQYKVGILKKIECSIVPLDVCMASESTTQFASSVYKHPYNNSTICTIYKNRLDDSCKFVGGSPIMCPYKDEPDRLVQVGLMEVGICLTNIPDLCVNVASVVDWINLELENRRY